MFASFATVPLSDCRAIEQRLNECVIALRSTEKLFADNSAIGRLINAAIANARKPLP